MSGIIEKLGITPGPLWLDGNNELLQGPMGVVKTGRVYSTARGDNDQSKANGTLYCAAPEILEALIDDYKFLEKFLSEKASVIGPEWYNLFYERQVAICCKIEKACYPKKWEEIKEIL